jgi:hypothetical protein
MGIQYLLQFTDGHVLKIDGVSARLSPQLNVLEGGHLVFRHRIGVLLQKLRAIRIHFLAGLGHMGGDMLLLLSERRGIREVGTPHHLNECLEGALALSLGMGDRGSAVHVVHCSQNRFHLSLIFIFNCDKRLGSVLKY